MAHFMQQVRESGVDVLRLSCIVRNNLEAEAEGGDYNAASTTGAPLNDVQINHQDAELDFDAKASEQGALCCAALNLTWPAIILSILGRKLKAKAESGR